MELNDEIKEQKNSELRKRVFRAIQSMYGLFRGSPRNIQIVDRYLNVWKPRANDVEDVVDFPYESKKGSLAEKKNANHCLFAMITMMIRLWHSHCGGNEICIEPLGSMLDKIELIVKNKLQFPIRGSDETGYYFKLPRGE